MIFKKNKELFWRLIPLTILCFLLITMTLAEGKRKELPMLEVRATIEYLGHTPRHWIPYFVIEEDFYFIFNCKLGKLEFSCDSNEKINLWHKLHKGQEVIIQYQDIPKTFFEKLVTNDKYTKYKLINIKEL